MSYIEQKGYVRRSATEYFNAEAFNAEAMVDTQIYEYFFKKYVTTLRNGDTIVQKNRRGKKGFVFCAGKLL